MYVSCFYRVVTSFEHSYLMVSICVVWKGCGFIWTLIVCLEGLWLKWDSGMSGRGVIQLGVPVCLEKV